MVKIVGRLFFSQLDEADFVDRLAVGHFLPGADVDDLHQFAVVKALADAQQHLIERLAFDGEDVFEAAVEHLSERLPSSGPVEQLGQPDRHRGDLPIAGGDNRDRQRVGGGLAVCVRRRHPSASRCCSLNRHRRRQVEIDLPFDRVRLERQNEKRQKLKRHVEHGRQVQRDFFVLTLSFFRLRLMI